MAAGATANHCRSGAIGGASVVLNDGEWCAATQMAHESALR